MRGNRKNDGYARHDVSIRSTAIIRHFETGNAIFSTPVIGEGERIYVGSADHSFYAFDAVEGKQLWSFATEGIIDSAACMDGSGMLSVPSGDGSIYQLTPDGQEVWRLDILLRKPRTLSTIYWWEGNATIGPNGWIYAGNDDFCLYAIDPTGVVQWTFASGLQIWSAPAFHQKLVYIASFDMSVYALEESTGYVRWKRKLDNSITSSPAIGEDGTLFIGCFDGVISALDGKTGKILWKRPTGGPVYASAAITPDHHVLIGSCDGNLYCLHADTGDILWTFDTHCPIWSSCSIARDVTGTHAYVIYMGDSKGRIIALSPEGTMIWTYTVALQKKQGKNNDINASIALGAHGLATASARGEVLYIPYDAYLHPTPEEAPHFLSVPDQTASTSILSNPENRVIRAETIPEKGLALQIRNIVFTTPAIITPLDQIGIVSLTITFRIVQSDPVTGKCIAWGLQTFGYNEDGLPVGIPEPRYYFYAFNGVVDGDTLRLQAKNCDFEITAFPIPLDSLSFVATKTPDGWEGKAVHGFLHSHYLMRTLVRRYGALSLSYIAIHLFTTPLMRGLHFHLASGWRTLCAVWMLFIQRRWKQWGLLDSDGNFTTIGSFALAPAPDKRRALEFQSVSFDARRRRITATFESHGTTRYDDGFPGILLIDQGLQEALPLPYWKFLKVRYLRHKKVTVTFTIPASVDLSRTMDAVVLVNCDVQTTLSLESGSKKH